MAQASLSTSSCSHLLHAIRDTCTWPRPVSRLLPGLTFSLCIGRCRHPASRDTCTSLCIGRCRHPASRDTCTSLCIEYCLDATLCAGHPVCNRTIKADDKQARPPPAVFDGLRQTPESLGGMAQACLSTGSCSHLLPASRDTSTTLYFEAPNLFGRACRPARNNYATSGV